jgi:hypothetical protein
MQSEKKQRHIVMAWELGGGFGHISRIAALAKGFLARGHRVSLCLSDLSRAYDVVGHLPVGLYQTPLWLSRLQTNREPSCFSDILLRRGYGSVKGLLALTRAWKGLFNSLSADLLVFDYAPTAFLATRDWPQPKIVLSSGFGESAPGAPDRCLRPWLPKGQEWTKASEKHVVGVVNRLLKKCGVTPIRYVADLFQADHFFLFTLPELDNPKNWQSAPATFLPPPSGRGCMEPAGWPPGTGKRVYAYLKPSSRHCLAAMQSITNLPCTGVIVCDGLAKQQAMRFARPGLNIYLESRDVSMVQKTADVVVCHAGKNTILKTLLAGKPLLLIPEQLEQFLNALQVEKQHAGICVRRDADQNKIQQDLARLMTEPGFSAASRSIAEKNVGINQLDPVATIVDHCEGLL